MLETGINSHSSTIKQWGQSVVFALITIFVQAMISEEIVSIFIAFDIFMIVLFTFFVSFVSL